MKIKINNSETRRFISLLSEMTTKDIKSRYKHAFLGFFWVILTPLLQMFIVATLFTLIIKTPVENYYIFLFSGLLFWNFFNISLTKAASSIIDQRTLIQKAKLPRVLIPISVVLSNFFHFIVSVMLLAGWVAIFKTVNFYNIFLLLLALVLGFLLTTGLSLLISAYNVKYRDTSYFLQIILQLLFYVTPILYPVSLIPAKYHFWFFINPLTGITQLIQFVFNGSIVPDTNVLFINFLIIVFVFLLGLKEFKRISPSFDDWV